MATSAFKSTSRRGGAESKASQSTVTKLRSHSVSAVSRASHGRQLDRSSSISSDFSYKRSNPLFSPENEIETDKGKNGSSGEIASINSNFSAFSSSASKRSNIVNGQRGRSITRNSDGGGGVKNGIGRSLSRVRGRSVSRGHYGGGASESEKAQDIDTQSDARNRNVKKQTGNNMKTTNSVRSKASHVKNSRQTTIQNQATDWSEDDSACNFQVLNVDDGISTGTLSEAEEKMDFQGNNISNNTATIVANVPPDLVNPGDIELILDIRREYASKLEESEERARKLRADLAIEEHRGQELERILKEIIPDPKTSSARKSHLGRRKSSERKRMSKRLTQEALAYFDECVSLSTFDSSDFSASEDPSYTSFVTPVGDALSLQKSGISLLSSNDHGSDVRQKQLLHCSENSALTAHSTSNEPSSSQEYRFSFAHKQLENVGTHQDIKSYIKHFGRDIHKDTEPEGTESYYDASEYILRDHIENVLLDRILFSNRIESGSLLLCGGAVSSSLFSPVI